MKLAPATTTARGAQAPGHRQQEPGEKKKINRKKRIQPKEGSFRPGAAASKMSARTMTFIVPVLSKLGTDEEFAALRAAAREVPQHSARVSVVGIGVDNGELRLKLRVSNHADGDDDDLISELFRELQPFYTETSLFQTSSDVPRWEYLIGDFVADKGTFA